jgi:flagellar assembly factor FliW
MERAAEVVGGRMNAKRQITVGDSSAADAMKDRMMRYQTTRFGEIQFPEEVVMQFSEGILGFPAERRYILLEQDAEGSPFKWLQSLDNPNLAFIVIDPLQIDPHYCFEIDIDTSRVINSSDACECAVMAVVNVPRDAPMHMTANLKAPLVVNVANGLGRQLVLGATHYAISTPVLLARPAAASIDEEAPLALQKAV